MGLMPELRLQPLLCEHPECGCSDGRAAECASRERPKVSFRDRLVAFELKLQAAMPEIRCPVHLCLGQEVVPEALHEALEPEDWLFSTHRSHGHYLAKGGSEERLWDEIMGLESGVNGGFSGSQSFSDPALRFHSTAIVGGLITVATGVAMAVKMQGRYEMVVCCIGDAATEQGAFWESINFAALHRLRILYICENNRLSVHSPLGARQLAPLRMRVESFGMSTWYGESELRQALAMPSRMLLPGFVEVPCQRMCNHVSAMEDIRE
jgi:pyruvate dehydrogenase E1 component alpha subunit